MTPKTVRRSLGLLLAVLLAVPFAATAGQPLSLEEAERLALSRDPTTARHREEARAREESAFAAGQLPNPLLIGEAMNMPLDGRVDEDPMARFRLGVRQTFPRGESRRLAREREQALARGDHARATDAERQARRAVRRIYLELAYQRRALSVLADNRSLFEDLLHIAERAFAAGTATRQEVLEAELELERLEDRISAVREREAEAAAELARRIGTEAAERPLTSGLPNLTQPGRAFETHPLLTADEADVAGRQRAIGLARQGYRPQWSLELSYGRAPGAMGSADSVSGMVMVDVPLFARQRVDSEVAAERHRHEAALHGRIERERMLRGQSAAARGRWQQLREREQRFDERLLESAQQHAEAAEQAYRAGTTDFTTLMHARVRALETRVDALRVATDRRQLQADLLYLLGEQE